MQDFGPLKLWMALLGTSWPLLGPIRSRNGCQHSHKKYPKNDPQNDFNYHQKNISLGPKMDPKMGRNGEMEAQAQMEASGVFLVPRCLQDCSRLPQVAHDSSKLAQNSFQDSPCSKIAPTEPQNRSRLLKIYPEMVPRWPQYGPTQ